MSNCYVFICLCIGISCMHVLGNGSINLMKQITLSTKKNVAPFLFFSLWQKEMFEKCISFPYFLFVCYSFTLSLLALFEYMAPFMVQCVHWLCLFAVCARLKYFTNFTVFFLLVCVQVELC